MDDTENDKKKIINSIEPYLNFLAKRLPNPLLVNKGKPKHNSANITAIGSSELISVRTEKDICMKQLIINKDIIERQTRFLSTIKTEGMNRSNNNSTFIVNNSNINDSSFQPNSSLNENDMSKQKIVPIDGPGSLMNSNQSTSINSTTSKGKNTGKDTKGTEGEKDDSQTELYIPKDETEHFDYLKYYLEAQSYKEDYAKRETYTSLVSNEQLEAMKVTHMMNLRRDLNKYDQSNTLNDRLQDISY